jgi:hypothetical protein
MNAGRLRRARSVTLACAQTEPLGGQRAPEVETFGADLDY